MIGNGDEAGMKADALSEIKRQGMPIPSGQPPTDDGLLEIEDLELDIDLKMVGRQTATLFLGPRGTPVNCLFDSGAAVTFILESKANEIGLPIRKPKNPMRLRLANGSVSTHLQGDFLRTVLAASSPTSGDVLPTTSSSSEFATPAAHPAQLNLSGGDRRGAGRGAPGVTPGASATGDDPVFIQHHDEREGVDEGVELPDDLPGGLPGSATALAIQDLRGNSARLKAAYEASLRDLPVCVKCCFS